MNLKKINDRTKKEQMFLLLLICIGVFGILCLSGCGGKSCETPHCGNVDDSLLGTKITGCSIPGCGGCISSGEGCNSACWPQSCKFIKGSWYGLDKDGDQSVDHDKITACDIRYFGDGCLGCGQKEKSCYFGYIDSYNKGHEIIYKGFIYGLSGHDERIIGCANGCGGCFGTDGFGKEYMNGLEDGVEIK